MGICSSRKKQQIEEALSSSEPEDILAEIEQLQFTKTDFIIKKGKIFKEKYKYGKILGGNPVEEVRKCRNLATNASRAVQILHKQKCTLAIE